jgi:hypothetical protein
VAHPEAAISDLVKYDSQGRKIWHLTEADFDGRRFANPLLLGENQFILSFGNFDLRYEIQEEVTDSKLIDETDALVAPITEGMIIDLVDYPTAAAIRVETAPEIVGSVLFDLNGVTTIDNEAPYTLPLPGTGTYTLTATPHAEADGQGKAGTPLTISFEVIDTPSATETPTPPPLPPFEPLSACWVRDWNQAQTEWHIDNPNPVPLSTNPEVRVRYNWTVYDAFDAQGSVVQSATGWDNANPNPLNTPLAKSLRLGWYLVIDGQSTEILGETVVNADASGLCPLVHT